MFKLLITFSAFMISQNSFAQDLTCDQVVKQNEASFKTVSDLDAACKGILATGDFQNDKDAVADVWGAFKKRDEQYEKLNLYRYNCPVAVQPYQKYVTARASAQKCLREKTYKVFANATPGNLSATVPLESAMCSSELNSQKNQFDFYTDREKACRLMRQGGSDDGVIRNRFTTETSTAMEKRRDVDFAYVADNLLKEVTPLTLGETQKCKEEKSATQTQVIVAQMNFERCLNPVRNVSDNTRVSHSPVKPPKTATPVQSPKAIYVAPTNPKDPNGASEDSYGTVRGN